MLRFVAVWKPRDRNKPRMLSAAAPKTNELDGFFEPTLCFSRKKKTKLRTSRFDGRVVTGSSRGVPTKSDKLKVRVMLSYWAALLPKLRFLYRLMCVASEYPDPSRYSVILRHSHYPRIPTQSGTQSHFSQKKWDSDPVKEWCDPKVGLSPTFPRKSGTQSLYSVST